MRDTNPTATVKTRMKARERRPWKVLGKIGGSGTLGLRGWGR
jgi:hypothetical protein